MTKITTNLGIVKSIFRQSTQPIRTDVLWYDTMNSVLKLYNTIALKWQPIDLYLSGSLTDSAPTSTEITAIVGISAADAGSGYQCTIKDTDGTGLLYFIESDGSNWFYIIMTKAV